MTRSIRPTTPADSPALLQLFCEAGLRPNVEMEALRWKYWQPRADWPDSRSFALTLDNVVIAHAAVIPGAYVSGAQRVEIAHVIDWVARSGHAGAGVALMKYIGQRFGALLAVGGSPDTLAILPHLGFQTVGMSTGFVRPLFPLRRLRDTQMPLHKRVPRVARSLVWQLMSPSISRSGWQVSALHTDGDLKRLASVLPSPRRGMSVIERSLEQMRYFLSCPIVPMQLHLVARAGKPAGYFLLASAPGQVRIADCWIDSEDLDDWRTLISLAVKQAKHDPQAAETVICANDPLLAAAVGACGFQARTQVPVQLRAARAAVMSVSVLRTQLLDSDAAYLHEGRNEYWG